MKTIIYTTIILLITMLLFIGWPFAKADEYTGDADVHTQDVFIEYDYYLNRTTGLIYVEHYEWDDCYQGVELSCEEYKSLMTATVKP